MDARTRARLGAFAQHARYDTRETTRAAREAFARRFEREVDPDGVLPEAERARRAEAAKRAHFQRMALRSAQARRKKRLLNAVAGRQPAMGLAGPHVGGRRRVAGQHLAGPPAGQAHEVALGSAGGQPGVGEGVA